MPSFLRQLYDVQRGEGKATALLFAQIFLLIASLLIVKPVRNSLFLSTYGAEQLPFVFLLVAAVSAGITLLYGRVAGRWGLLQLILATLGFSALLFALFWTLIRLQAGGSWLYYAFYIWVAIFGLLTTTQFWLLANHVFHARQAKRLFSLLGSGAILGGITGGYLTKLLAPVLGTVNLILVSMAMLAACAVLTRLVWAEAGGGGEGGAARGRRSRERERSGGEEESPLKLVLRSRHLRYLAALVGTGVLAANLVDYQFNAIASSIIRDEDALTAFFGFWMSNLSVLSLLVQLFITSRVLKNLGVAASLYFLPVGILVGAVAVLLAPALWSAVLVKVSDGSFKQSINKSGLELLALPVPRRVKERTKAFIDVFVDNLATGTGGLLLLLLVGVLSLPTRAISLVILPLVLLWILLIHFMKREYIQSFRTAIRKRTLDLGEEAIQVEDASALEPLLEGLEDQSERQVLYILDLVADAPEALQHPRVRQLLDHPSPAVRARMLELLRAESRLDVSGRAEELLEEQDERVRRRALEYLAARSPDPQRLLENYLERPDPGARALAATALGTLAGEVPGSAQRLDPGALLKSHVGAPGSGALMAQPAPVRSALAHSLGMLDDPSAGHYLLELLGDEEREVLEEALLAAGRRKDLELLGPVCEHLNTKLVRRAARKALALYGSAAAHHLIGLLEDPGVDLRTRREVPRVLARIGGQQSVDALLRQLQQEDSVLCDSSIRALSRLKLEQPELNYQRKRVERVLHDQVHQYYDLLNLLRGQKEGEGLAEQERPAHQLLVRALEERLDRDLARIFRLLGLRYSSRAMQDAYSGIISGNPALRENAVEFLDNVLDLPVKRLIIPIVEEPSRDALLHRLANRFEEDPPAREEGLRRLAGAGQSWLAACAIHLLGVRGGTALRPMLETLAAEADSLVRESALWALKRIRDGENPPEGRKT